MYAVEMETMKRIKNRLVRFENLNTSVFAKYLSQLKRLLGI